MALVSNRTGERPTAKRDCMAGIAAEGPPAGAASAALLGQAHAARRRGLYRRARASGAARGRIHGNCVVDSEALVVAPSVVVVALTGRELHGDTVAIWL